MICFELKVSLFSAMWLSDIPMNSKLYRGNMVQCSDWIEGYRVHVPSNQCYFLFLGAKIPGGATLLFDVELLGIMEADAQPNIFKQIDTDEDKKISKDEVRYRERRLAGSTAWA